MKRLTWPRMPFSPHWLNTTHSPVRRHTCDWVGPAVQLSSRARELHWLARAHRSGGPVPLPERTSATLHPSSARTHATISPCTPTWPSAYLVNPLLATLASNRITRQSRERYRAAAATAIRPGSHRGDSCQGSSEFVWVLASHAWLMQAWARLRDLPIAHRRHRITAARDPCDNPRYGSFD